LIVVYSFLENTDIIPVVFEKRDFWTFLKLIIIKGNRIEIDGYYFFSKSEETMNELVNEYLLMSSPQDNFTILCSLFSSRIFFPFLGLMNCYK
jgi:hypothetical protein